jgi:hypothetical protein
MLPMRPLALSLLCATALPLTGCCSIARAWCGPDKSPWVSIDFRTPELATRTLLEALRRDEPQIVYDALSDDLRRQMGIDGLALQLAWAKIKEQYPYLHVAGYAEVPPARIDEQGSNATIVVDVEGTPLQIGLVRQTYWELRYRRPGADLTPDEREARFGHRLDNLTGTVRIELDAEAEEDRSFVSLLPQNVLHSNIDEIPIANVESLGVRREWKIRTLDQLTEGN